jgi:non-ribosomal peptide synthetase-like protein
MTVETLYGNATTAGTTGDSCLHEIFEKQARETPDAIAVVCGDRRWSYREIDRRSTRMAGLLRRYGAGPGHFVAIYFDRSELPVIAILACHKSGAAYVPIDPSYPGERVAYICGELGPVLCLTEAALHAKAEAFFPGTRVLALDNLQSDVTQYPDAPLDDVGSGVSPSDLAYVIYTSGSTGRPKGVMAEHRAVVRYVQAFNEVCGTDTGDRVYQGFSLSFDGSVEEIWMAFSNGSTLVVPTRDAPRFGDDLADYLSANGVTYFSTVPTMLATVNSDVPSLRTIVLSGEVCPPELVSRWAGEGRRLLNVYGPTEATVNTTAAVCRPGAPVTIGRPLPGYRLFVVDEHMRPVPRGRLGELLIGGPMLARGYVEQPALSRERFVDVALPEHAGRCYRTGDLVRWTDDDELEFHGRIDTQVKIRGYRVELSEIESVLVEHPYVRAAAVHLVERDCIQQLAACVVGDGPSAPERESILDLLETRLPAYMIPGYLDVVSSLPRTTSGKLDRRRLPEPEEPLVHTSREQIAPETDLEDRIAAVWQDTFAVSGLSVTDDFFLDLGGHSLIAAQMVTRLRERISRDVTVRDVYESPTVRTLAGRLESQASAVGALPAPRSEAAPPSARAAFESLSVWRRSLTAFLQALSVYLLSAVPAVPLALLFLLILWRVQGQVSTTTVVLVWLTLILLTWPVLLTLSIAAKWLLIGRYRPGEHRLWSGYYFRWWLCDRITALSGAGGLIGTPVFPLYCRLMGATIGPRCTLDTAQFSAWDLVSIGADTSIGADSQLLGYRVEDGMIKFGAVRVGSGCFVGIHCALGLDVGMGDESSLDDQSLLADGDVVPAGEGRRGSPARPAVVSLPEARPPVSTARRALFGMAHVVAAELLGLLSLLPFVGYIAVYVLMFLLGGVAGVATALALSVPLVVVTACLFLAAERWLILRRMQPGTYPVDSAVYVRKWLSDGLMRGARTLLLPIYTTLYLPPWLRLMGARIGPRAELSTVWNFAPELIDVGPESFFADGSIIGGRRVHRGAFQVSVNRIGRRSFVGNSAILPVGSSLGDGCLLGVQSVPPAQVEHVPDGSEWLGSPPFPLSHRPKVGDFGETVTFRPTRRLYLQRAVVDGLRILIPGYLLQSGLAAWGFLEYEVWRTAGTAFMFILAPLGGLAVGLGAVVCVAALKKAVMGTYRPVIKPLWCMYVWLNEMVNGAYESIVAPVLTPFLGTPFVAPLLRLMGCRIGRHTYIATTLMSEFDLVEIGDHAALNHGVVVQNHLFEDRVFKSSSLRIGPETAVGNMSVLLYDTTMERGAVVGPLSLLMKGETLAAGSRWQGIPTEPAAPRHRPAPSNDVLLGHGRTDRPPDGLRPGRHRNRRPGRHRKGRGARPGLRRRIAQWRALLPVGSRHAHGAPGPAVIGAVALPWEETAP